MIFSERVKFKYYIYLINYTEVWEKMPRNNAIPIFNDEILEDTVMTQTKDINILRLESNFLRIKFKGVTK